jgi:cell division FtsZ-interacting protein ZapD
MSIDQISLEIINIFERLNIANKIEIVKEIVKEKDKTKDQFKSSKSSKPSSSRLIESSD